MSSIEFQQKNINGENNVSISISNNDRLDFNSLVNGFKDEERIKSYQDYLNIFRNFMYTKKEIDLRNIYVPLSIEIESDANKKYTNLEGKIQKGEYQSRKIIVDKDFSFNKLFDDQQSKRIVNIIGTAGQGKSTLLRYISSLELFKKEYIPIYIPCLQLAREDVYNCIRNNLERFWDIPEMDNKQLSAFIKYINNKFKILIILDGFDEIPNDDSKEVMNQIEVFSDKFLLPVLMSSRPGSESYFSTKAIQYKLCDLSAETLHKVIKNYTSEETNVKSIFNNLGANISFTECIKTPLLACLVADNYIHFQNIPQTPKAFYNQILDVLLRRHDESKKERVIREFHKKHPNIDDELFGEIFNILCLSLLIKKKSNITLSELMQYSDFAISHSKCNFIKIDNKKSLSRDFILSLINDTCLIIEDGGSDEENKYSFCHKSIWEFYSAKFFQKLTPKEKWHEDIILFMLERYMDLDVFFLNNYEFICMLDDMFVLKYLLLPYLEKIGISDDGKKNRFDNATRFIQDKFYKSSIVHLRKRQMNIEEIENILSRGSNLKDNKSTRKRIIKNSSVSEFHFRLPKISIITFIMKFLNHKTIDTEEVEVNSLIHRYNTLLETVLEKNDGFTKISNYLDNISKGKKQAEKRIHLDELLKKIHLDSNMHDEIHNICYEIYDNVYLVLKKSLISLEEKKAGSLQSNFMAQLQALN